MGPGRRRRAHCVCASAVRRHVQTLPLNPDGLDSRGSHDSGPAQEDVASGLDAGRPDNLVEGTNLDGEQGVFRIDLSTGAITTVGELPTASTTLGIYAAVSTNGREVFHARGGTIWFTGVQARDLASGALRTVFDGPVMNFALSPDGRFLAIASPNRDSATDQTPPFRVVPIAGGESRALGTELAPVFHDTGFAWSADGRYLYFARATPEGRNALWRTPVDGGPAQQVDIPFPRQRLLRISVHPDGLLAIRTRAHDIESFAMRNIPPAAKR